MNCGNSSKQAVRLILQALITFLYFHFVKTLPPFLLAEFIPDISELLLSTCVTAFRFWLFSNELWFELVILYSNTFVFGFRGKEAVHFLESMMLDD